MTLNRVDFLLLLFGCLTLFCAGFAFAVEPGFIDTSVKVTTNLHFSGKFCVECHDSATGNFQKENLRFGNNFTATCRCHGYSAGTYIHPVDVIPSAEKRAAIPAEMPIVAGKIVCLTCHDIAMQCRDDVHAREENRAFLRGAPYRSRTGLCVRCHQQGKFRMFDPHNQLDSEGKIVAEKCLYCHADPPDAVLGTFRSSNIHDRTVTLIGDLDILCHRCHFKQSTLHPINADHFRVPSQKIQTTMQESEERLGILLPLDYSGKVMCATCHNPHERGVIPLDHPASRGASEKYRLRVPGQAGQMCRACHKK